MALDLDLNQEYGYLQYGTASVDFSDDNDGNEKAKTRERMKDQSNNTEDSEPIQSLLHESSGPL
jgi:hypothetical protein